jgi:hypothetical protein
MVDTNKIWVGRNGERFGPYDEATLRAWIAEGKVEATALGWREGMADWQPLHVLLGIAVPPPLAGAPFGDMAAGRRNELMPPPDFHWAGLFVIDLFVGGLLGLVWQFIQASWIKKIDPSSRAMLWLVISLCILPVAWFLMLGVVLNHSTDGPPDAGAIAGAMAYVGMVFLMALASIVLRFIAFFSMARSMREQLPAYGLVPEIGNITLFFFSVYYLQGQMSWVARWRTTGRDTPPAPKAVFWWLVLGWIGLCMMLAFLVGLAMFGHAN